MSQEEEVVEVKTARGSNRCFNNITKGRDNKLQLKLKHKSRKDEQRNHKADNDSIDSRIKDLANY